MRTTRTVTDAVGTAESIVLSDKSTAQRDQEDRLHDYYEELEADDMAGIVETATGSEIAYEDNERPIGAYDIRVEWSAERCAEAIYEYLDARGENVTMGRTSVSIGAVSLALAGAWCRCSDGEFGWVEDETDVEVAAEYLRAVAHEN